MIIYLKKLTENLLRINFVRTIITNYNYFLYKFLSQNSLLASFYLTFFSGSLKHEHQALTKGIFNYYRTIKKLGANTAALRRNIHRLEKGLLMRPRRPVFALHYIEETINIYKNSLHIKDIYSDHNQLKWAHDVLQQYFKASDPDHHFIRKLKLEFNKLPKPDKFSQKENFIPYTRDKEFPTKHISYDVFLKLSKQRKSVRWFKNKRVPRLLIDKALEAAAFAPSACNRQPFHYRIFDDKKIVSQISQIPFGTAGFADNIPLIIVMIGDLSNFFSPRDRHLIYIDTALSVMAFVYALETLGLSSTCINWPDFNLLEKKLSKILNLKPHERPVMLIAVGFPDDNQMVAYSKRKDIASIRSYN